MIRAAWADYRRVREGWRIPRKQTVSAWAKEHRVLTERESAEPGNWNNDRAPYLREIMDTCGDPEISEVVAMKAVQVGLSEAMRNVFGYWMDQDPGPMLIVMPTEELAQEQLDEKVAPMIRGTAVLARHLSERKRDTTRKKIILDHMDIHVGWAGSPASLASRPRRYASFDETDKYPEWSGREADPISLGEKRLTTYGRRSKRLKFSSPTTRSGPIFKAWDRCPVQKSYWLPCPFCERYFVPSFVHIKWPKDLKGTRHDTAERIDQEQLAWLECPHCKEKITERYKPAMLGRGLWAAQTQTVEKGVIVGPKNPSRSVAYHVSGLISPWVTWSSIAAQWLKAIGDETLLMDFRNSVLGEPYEVQAVSMKSVMFADKIKAGHKRLVVPAWAGLLLATADTQKDHFVYTIRAWGWGWRSRLIDHGKCFTFKELKAKTIAATFTNENADREAMQPKYLLIDSGGGLVGEDQSRTDQVYRFALSEPGRVFALKGLGGGRPASAPIRLTHHSYAPPGAEEPYEISLYIVDTGYFKDVLSNRIKQPKDELGNDPPDAWELHSEVDAEYCEQMASERKVIIRKGRTHVMQWVPIAAHAPNHFWDAEVYQQVAAQIAHVETIASPEDLALETAAIEKLQNNNDQEKPWLDLEKW